MTNLNLHSKLIELQGQIISATEKENFLSKIVSILDLNKSGELSLTETASRIRKTANRIAEDLRLNDISLSSGSDSSLLEQLPVILKFNR